MQQYRDGGFVGEDSLRFVDCHSVLLLQGEIACRGLIVITVTKLIDYVTDDADPLVQMEMYSYNVSVRGQGLAFRYDNQHPTSSIRGILIPTIGTHLTLRPTRSFPTRRNGLVRKSGPLWAT